MRIDRPSRRALLCATPPGVNLDLLAWLFDHSLILVVGANPDPDEVCAVLDGGGAVIDPNPCGP